MGYNLSKTERARFVSAINAIPENLEYVILRNYDSLPKSVPGTDIDILVRSNQQAEAKEIFQQYDFQKYGTIYTRYRPLIKKMAFSPIETVQYALSRPKKIAELILKLNSKVYYWGKENFSMVKLQCDSLEVDFYNHLAYRSPTNNQLLKPMMIRVDTRVEQSMIENRIHHPTEDFYIPSPPDELVHMICRGVFDHKGKFRKYYISRCNELYEKVSANPEYMARYQTLLEHIFYQCADLVDSHISQGKYNTIKPTLKSATDY